MTEFVCKVNKHRRPLSYDNYEHWPRWCLNEEVIQNGTIPW